MDFCDNTTRGTWVLKNLCPGYRWKGSTAGRQLNLERLNHVSMKLLQEPTKRWIFVITPPFLFLLLYFHVLSSFLPTHPISWIQNRSLQKLLLWWMFSEIYNHKLMLRWNTFNLSLYLTLDTPKRAWIMAELLGEIRYSKVPRFCCHKAGSWLNELALLELVVYISNSWRSTWENINTCRENSNCSRNYYFSWHEWPLVWVITS